MGGFANLKKDFDSLVVTLRPDSFAPDADRDYSLDLVTHRYLELRCLFEIAGNLDTIAVEMRNQTKVSEAMLLEIQKANAINALQSSAVNFVPDRLK